MNTAFSCVYCCHSRRLVPDNRNGADRVFHKLFFLTKQKVQVREENSKGWRGRWKKIRNRFRRAHRGSVNNHRSPIRSPLIGLMAIITIIALMAIVTIIAIIVLIMRPSIPVTIAVALSIGPARISKSRSREARNHQNCNQYHG